MIEMSVKIKAGVNVRNTQLALRVLDMLQKAKDVEVHGHMSGVPLLGKIPIDIRR